MSLEAAPILCYFPTSNKNKRPFVEEETVVLLCTHEIMYGNRFAISMRLLVNEFLSCYLKQQDEGLVEIFFTMNPNYEHYHKFCLKYYARVKNKTEAMTVL
jgi:hypothetical protein